MWVTDVRTCFLTTHEKLEYVRLKKTLQCAADRDGRVFQFCIVMTKCDVDVDADAKRREPAKPRVFYPGEITSEHEDTTVHVALAYTREALVMVSFLQAAHISRWRCVAPNKHLSRRSRWRIARFLSWLIRCAFALIK